MSEIIAKFNTVTKTLSVTENGKAVANVAGVDFYLGYAEKEGDEPPFRCNVMTAVEDPENKTFKYTRLCASVAGALAAEEPAQPADDEAAKKAADKLAEDVAQYLSKE